MLYYQKDRATLALVAVSLFACCGTYSTQFIAPNEICYDGIRGFDPALKDSLEWQMASTIDSTEPPVEAFLQPPKGLRIRWLGAAGYEISDDSTSILIDPFVSRPTVGQLLSELQIDTVAVNHYVLQPVDKKNLKVILVAHAHHDHFLDVPYILSRFKDPSKRPLLVGSPNVHRLIMGYDERSGVTWADEIGGLVDSRFKLVDVDPSNKTCRSNSNNVGCKIGRFGEFEVTAFGTLHVSYDHLGPAAIDGIAQGHPPYVATEYKTFHNGSIGYLVTYKGLRLFFSESPILLHPKEVGPVDILILGIAARGEYNTISQSLTILRPEYVIPTHYDDFFKPLSRFGKFDAKLGFWLLDFSRFEDFVRSFQNYQRQANHQYGDENGNQTPPKLRLMKLLYHYSLESLLN